MNTLRQYVLQLSCVLAMVVCVVLMSFGAWKGFGRALLQPPGSFSVVESHWPYLIRWIGPATATYACLLAAGILLGLRSRRKALR
jgi:hypothetical protein